jgi:hypothetical protein
VSPRYEFTVAGEASRFLFGSTDRVRRKAEMAFESLAKHPFTVGDFEETSPAGRKYQVKVFDDLIVTFWVDHAARELSIVECAVVD